MGEQNRVSKWFVGMAVLLVVVGVVMIVWPNLTMELLGTMIGICLLVVGLAYIILYFTKDHMGNIMQMDLTAGVVLSAFGAFMLMHHDFVSLALPFAAGIVLLIGGISKIQYALDMKRLNFSKWYLMLILASILIVLALVLLYNPFRDKILIYVMGGSMIIDGAASIAAVLLISHRIKKMNRGAVYTGRENLIEEKQVREAGGRGRDKVHVPGEQPPMETVDDPVMAQPEERAGKRGGFFSKWKHDKDAAPQETPQDMFHGMAQEAPQDMPQEMPQGVSEDTPREVPTEAARPETAGDSPSDQTSGEAAGERTPAEMMPETPANSQGTSGM